VSDKNYTDELIEYMKLNQQLDYDFFGLLPSSEVKPYKFPLYIKNKETKLVYKLLMAYEDNPGGLYTRQDDFDSRLLLQKYEIEDSYEVLG
jgi:hypothetical protein